MGRPIKKKFFGNTNSGVATPGGDNNIGGEGIASVTITNAGDYTGTLPTVSFGTPDIPTGVQATGVVHGKALAATTFAANGSGYQMGDTLSLTGGTADTRAQLTVTGVVTVGTPVLTAAGINYDVAGAVKDEIWFEGAGWSIPLKIRVDTVTGGNGVATFTVIQQGYWIGPGAAPTSVTGTETHNGPLDGNGTGATFTLTYGVRTASVAVEGDYTVVPTNPVATTVTPAGGTGATITAHWGVKSIAMTQNGSGYISVADAAPTFSSGTAAGTSVLQATQENALLGVYRNNGADVGYVDIVKQESSTSFWVNTGSDVILLDLIPSNGNHGLYLRATDSAGGTYWVRKIEARTATLGTVGGTGTQWKDYGRAQWTFGTPVAGVSVTIRNAA